MFLQVVKSKIIRNLNTIENFVKDQIIILEYLNDYEIQELYKNCNALVMPTLVGYSSLPLYEAFFFNKQFLYKVFEENLKDFVTKIDIENTDL